MHFYLNEKFHLNENSRNDTRLRQETAFEVV